MLWYFIKAWIIGIAIAAPVGPIGVLCIKKTLEIGLKGAIAVGIGAALADGAYGIIAALGLSAVSSFLLGRVAIIKLAGGLFLLYLAYTEIKNAPTHVQSASSKSKSLPRLAAEIFFLTITNPMTILSFIGIFASISGGPATVQESVVMVVGIILGSMSWWLILGYSIVRIKHKLPEAWLYRIRYASAMILGGFGVLSLMSIMFG